MLNITDHQLDALEPSELQRYVAQLTREMNDSAARLWPSGAQRPFKSTDIAPLVDWFRHYGFETEYDIARGVESITVFRVDLERAGIRAIVENRDLTAARRAEILQKAALREYAAWA